MVPLAAEPIAFLGSFAITNTLFNAILALIFFTVIGLLVRSHVTSGVPKRFQTAMELLTDGLLEFFDQVTGSRELSKKFLPFVGTCFVFILFSNWFGMFPGTGSIGFWVTDGSTRDWVPLMRAATSDLNLTIGLALSAVVVSHLVGLRSQGTWRHMNRFIQIQGIINAIKQLSLIGLFVALIEFVVGIIELFGEFAKIASLSLRLFGNVFAGDVLLNVVSGLMAWIAPLPFMSLEVIVGVVQATVFSVLALVYMTIMNTAPPGTEEGAHH